MAIITKTVGAIGADYTTISAWDAGEQTDLVATGDSHVVSVLAGEITEAEVVITSWTTSATNTITIQAAAGAEYTGTLRANGGGNAKLTLTATGTSAPMRPSVPYITLYGLEIESTSTANGLLSNNFGQNNLSLINLHLTDANNVSTRASIIVAGSGNLLRNVFLSTSGRGIEYRNTSTSVIQNCTVIGLGGSASFGILTDSLVTLENSIAIGFSSEDVYGVPGTNNTNASGDGSIGATITTADFVDHAGGDYSIDATGALYNVGTDLSAQFTDDVTGATRATWDIGAFGVAVTGLTLTSITPTTGPSTGGTTVTMTGTGFEAGTVPKFNGVDATSVTIVSDTELTCVTPAL